MEVNAHQGTQNLPERSLWRHFKLEASGLGGLTIAEIEWEKVMDELLDPYYSEIKWLLGVMGQYQSDLPTSTPAQVTFEPLDLSIFPADVRATLPDLIRRKNADLKLESLQNFIEDVSRKPSRPVWLEKADDTMRNRFAQAGLAIRFLTGLPNDVVACMDQSKESRAQQSKARLASELLRMVRFIVAKFKRRVPSFVEYDDLFGEGVVALLSAIDVRFDPNKVSTFRIYVSQRISGAMIDMLRGCDSVPRHVRDRAKELSAIRAHLEKLQEGKVSDGEVAAYMNLTLGKFRKFEAGAQIPVISSLQVFGDGEHMHDVPDGFDFEGAFDDAEVRKILMGLLKTCYSNKEIDVVCAYYIEGHSLNDIGEALGVTPSRASQMKRKGLSILGDLLRRQL